MPHLALTPVELATGFTQAPSIPANVDALALGAAVVEEVGRVVTAGGFNHRDDRAVLAGKALRASLAAHPAGLPPDHQAALVAACRETMGELTRQRGYTTPARIIGALGEVAKTSREAAIERRTTAVRGEHNRRFADTLIILAAVTALYVTPDEDPFS